MKRFLALSLLACGALAAVNTAAAPVVESIRLHDYGSKTRVVLDLSEPVPPYQLGALTGPDRVLIDLSATALDSKFGNMPKGAGVVSAIRSSAKAGGGLRVVFDL